MLITDRHKTRGNRERDSKMHIMEYTVYCGDCMETVRLSGPFIPGIKRRQSRYFLGRYPSLIIAVVGARFFPRKP